MESIETKKMEMFTDMVAEAVFDLIVNDKLRFVGVGKDTWGIIPYGYGTYDIDRADREYWEMYEDFLRDMGEDKEWLQQEFASQVASWEVLYAA